MKRAGLKRPGLQGRIARKTGIPHSTVSCIFRGVRRATPEQAVLMEPILESMGYHISAWAMSSCPRGTKLLDLAEKH